MCDELRQYNHAIKDTNFSCVADYEMYHISMK